MGNESIVRGALEAGIRIAASYPGTPASEIGNTFAEVAKEMGIHFEWSTNEKVAFEVVYGASMCNQRGMVSMKHVGLNVALDIMEMAALRGVKEDSSSFPLTTRASIAAGKSRTNAGSRSRTASQHSSQATPRTRRTSLSTPSSYPRSISYPSCFARSHASAT